MIRCHSSQGEISQKLNVKINMPFNKEVHYMRGLCFKLRIGPLPLYCKSKRHFQIRSYCV